MLNISATVGGKYNIDKLKHNDRFGIDKISEKERKGCVTDALIYTGR